jgi:hypothetical protein
VRRCAPPGPRPIQRPASNRTGLPDRLKAGVEALSGLSMDDLRVHRNSNGPARLGALAYAKGSDIYLGPGQERHLPHEAWHLVQQKQARVRPTMQLKGGVAVNDDSGLEREADAMGAHAASAPSGRDASHPAASSPAGVVQRQLIANGNHYADTRDTKAVRQQFTPAAGGAIAQGPAPAGQYVDGAHYHYQYDPATQQYRVTGRAVETYWDVAAPGKGQEYLRETCPGHPLHRYTPYENSPAYRYFKGGYQRSPKTRGKWVDALNRFVEKPGDADAEHPDPKARVLTGDQTGVEKHYVIGKMGRDFVIPIKKLDQDFLPGVSVTVH